MTQSMLKLAPGFELAPEMALQNNGILAKSGAGKSNTSVVMAEEFHAAGVPWIAVDPKGDWWGIRASASGKGAGLEIPVFGGLHGDLPLEEEAGRMMAELIAETRLTCILDVSEFSSHQAMLDFLTDFAEALYRKNRDPLHVFAEEADEYLPQKVRKNGQDCLNAWSKLVKRGRFRGLFVTLISQRSAALNNEALSQVDTLIPMRTTAPPDRKAIEGWVTAHDFGKDLIDSLPTLKDGELWLWSPHKLELKKRVRFRRRRTFDSGATPGLGERLVPAKLADINLDSIRDRMADTIERAEQEDPSKLQERVAELEQELSRWKGAGLPVGEQWESLEDLIAAVRQEPQVVEVPTAVLDEETQADLHVAFDEMRFGVEPLPKLLEKMQIAVEGGRNVLERAEALVGKTPIPDISRDDHGTPGAGNGSSAPPPPPAPRENPGKSQASANGAEGLSLAERKILGVLAQFPEGRTKVQVAILTGYSAKSGGFNNALGKLRGRGLISEARVEPIVATPEGVVAAGTVEPLPRGPELLAYWKGKLSKAERGILEVLFDHPHGLNKEQLGLVTGYSSTSGGFNNALGKLRSLELISPARVEPITISEVFR